MAGKPLHLGWFMNFTPGEWDHPLAAGGAPWDGKFYVDMAQALERACFDYIMIEDTLMVSEAYGDSAEAALKHALQVPKHDPAPLAALISAATTRLGVVATLSTLAEYVELVCKLFDSWDDDAVVMDRATGTYADYRKVRPVHYEGKYFKCRGPLNTVRSPQGKPVFVQAGGSPRGRAFAARHADSIIAIATGVEGMKQYRDDVRRHAVTFGRDPDDIKVLFLIYPILAETDEEAQVRRQRLISSPSFIERALASTATVTDIDFSKYDLDQPLPRLTTNGEQGSLDKFAQWGSGKTLRQLAMERFSAPGSEVDFVGSPETVADRMANVMEQVGGDGFLISTPFQRTSRRFIVEVTEGLVPALQRRGLMRTAYSGKTLREVLGEY